MQARWVIAGMFVVIGGYSLATVMFFWLGVDVEFEWRMYAVGAIAAFGAGALMVAHAPLRPWREPAAAGMLAIAALAAVAIARSDAAFDGFLARLWRPWYVGLGVAVASGAIAAAGGLAVRRIATATPRTGLILVLSALVVTGITGLLVLSAYASSFRTLVVVTGVAAGGFITQTVIAPKRPWACGAGGGMLVLFTLARPGLNREPSEIASVIFGLLLFILIGYGGALLAWRILRRGDAPSSPDVPPARLG